MPFKSEAQRRWMYANKPGMAKRWQDHTSKNSKLPKKLEKTSEQIAQAVLIKCAAQSDNDMPPAAAAIRGGAAGIAAGFPASVAASEVAKRGLIGQGDERATPGLVKKLLKAEGSGKKLPIHTVPTEGQSAYVTAPGSIRKKLQKKMPPDIQKMLAREQLMLPTKVNPFIAAHEVGHATGGRLSKALMKYRPAIALGSRLGGLGLLGHAAITSEEGKDMPLTGYLAPAAAAIEPLAVQGEELRATLKARKLLNKAKIKMPNLGKMMRAQQLNYLLGNVKRVAPLGLGALGLHQYMKSKKKAEPATGEANA